MVSEHDTWWYNKLSKRSAGHYNPTPARLIEIFQGAFSPELSHCHVAEFAMYITDHIKVDGRKWAIFLNDKVDIFQGIYLHETTHFVL